MFYLSSLKARLQSETFCKLLSLVILSSMLISCGGGSSNSNEEQIEINSQTSTDSSSQNSQSNTKKVIEEINS